MLNMNRCIQCTRCVRFTQEISKTGEIGFFERGSHAEIGTFPGKPLDNPLSTCVVDICPVGALTSTRFRFAERVWYLDKKPSICTGCDVGCNVTLEHRRGAIRRYKPRFNPEVNDYWMCDHGRASQERYREARLLAPSVRRDGEPVAAAWKDAVHALFQGLRAKPADGSVAILGSGFLSTEEAFLLHRLAEFLETPHTSVHVESGPERKIPNLHGGVRGSEAAPNRRGAELAGLVPGQGGSDAHALLYGDAAEGCAAIFVADSDLGAAAHDPAVVERLRKARFLAVMGWADTPLTAVADVVLPVSTHAERDGTFVNSQNRLQRFQRAFPGPAQVRPAVEVLAELLGRFDSKWAAVDAATAFDLLAEEVDALDGLRWATLPAGGVSIAGPSSSESAA